MYIIIKPVLLDIPWHVCFRLRFEKLVYILIRTDHVNVAAL